MAGGAANNRENGVSVWRSVVKNGENEMRVHLLSHVRVMLSRTGIPSPFAFLMRKAAKSVA